MAEITIKGTEHVNWDTDAALFTASLSRALRHSHGDHPRNVRLTCTPRVEAPHPRAGWLEYSLLVLYPGDRKLVIGCIQRQIGAECEFHS